MYVLVVARLNGIVLGSLNLHLSVSVVLLCKYIFPCHD